MSGLSSRLLKYALPLVKEHGFTREALARSVLSVPKSETVSGQAHTEPLSDRAVSALFGDGDEARRTLIKAWLQQGLTHMGTVPGVVRSVIVHPEDFPRTNGSTEVDAARDDSTVCRATVGDVLRARLEYNEPVLAHLPEAFSLLISPSNGIPPLDFRPALKHAFQIADTACFVTRDQSLLFEWYTRRASLSLAYTAAELHQLTSPLSASAFLGSLLESSSNLKSSLDEVALYSSYMMKSWRCIIRSSGVL